MPKKNETSPQASNELQIEINEVIAEGLYSNLVIVRFSRAEFILDFINVMPNTIKSQVKARMILTPQHAKRLLQELNDNIRAYESDNGPINELGTLQLPLHFGGPEAQA